MSNQKNAVYAGIILGVTISIISHITGMSLASIVLAIVIGIAYFSALFASAIGAGLAIIVGISKINGDK